MPALIRRFHEAKQSNAPTVTCWGSGTPLREFLHADDLGEACVFALEHWSALSPDAPKDDKGAPLAFLNVGTGIDLSIRELAEMVAQAVGYRGNYSMGQKQARRHPQETTEREQTPRSWLVRKDNIKGRATACSKGF